MLPLAAPFHDTMKPAELIRACYLAYETNDRAALEKLLADDFTFSSPVDDQISRELYFERCWPNSEHLTEFDIKELTVEGDHAFVSYAALTTHGDRFRNTEFFTFSGGKITSVQVYFGSEDPGITHEIEVRALMAETAAACRAKDVAALLRNYAPDVTAFDLIDPLRYCGANAVERRAGEWFASFEGPIDYQLHDLNIAAANGVAFCHSLNQVTGTKTDGQPLSMYWRSTACCEKRDGKWLITHVHNSVPFDMETGKASLDLTPSRD